MKSATRSENLLSVEKGLDELMLNLKTHEKNVIRPDSSESTSRHETKNFYDRQQEETNSSYCSEIEDDKNSYSSSDSNRDPKNTPLKLLTFSSQDFHDIPTGEESADFGDPDLLHHGDILQNFMDTMKLETQTHIWMIKKKLRQDKEVELKSKDSVFKEMVARNQRSIADMNGHLDAVTSRYSFSVQRGEKLCETLAVQHAVRNIWFTSKFAISKIFYSWRSYTNQIRQFSHLERIANRIYCRSLLTRYFAQLSRHSTAIRSQRRWSESKSRFDTISKQMVENYENDLLRLQKELTESKEALSKEIFRRQQLEEDLRRMFLKNITTMNMEALSLFQHPAVLPPQLSDFGPLAADKIVQDENAKSNAHQTNLKSLMVSQQLDIQSKKIDLSATAGDSRTLLGDGKGNNYLRVPRENSKSLGVTPHTLLGSGDEHQPRSTPPPLPLPAGAVSSKRRK